MKYFEDTVMRKLLVRIIFASLFLLNFINLLRPTMLHISIFILIFFLLGLLFFIAEKLLLSLNQLEEQLIEEAKMAEMGKMIGAITHEINNPIGIIKSQAMIGLMMLQKGNNEIEGLTKLFQSVKNNCERTNEIIINIKNAVSKKLNADEIGVFPLKSVIDRAVGFMKIKLDKTSIKVNIEFNENDVVFGNFGQLEHVFLNLISNSIDAIKDQVNPWIKIQYRQDASHYYITSIDSGLGIPDEYLRKIEKGFFTSKGSGKGSGQGLVLCKKILRNHGGELYYVKAANTTFELKLPKKLDGK